jgi:hypothetical protein
MRFAALSAESLRALAAALANGALVSPYRPLSLERFLPRDRVEDAARDLTAAEADGFGAVPLARLLEALAEERSAQRAIAERVELVWSGPESATARTRDTAVVVDELFRRANRSVLVSGYALYQGKRIFRELAASADARPELEMRLFFNVHRDAGDTRSDAELLRCFADRFRSEQWPGRRLPRVHYDPRALAAETGPRSCLHAKCVVADGERAFVTSANFTEAAQDRNIEAGVLVESRTLAGTLMAQFENLVASRALLPVPGLG